AGIYGCTRDISDAVCDGYLAAITGRATGATNASCPSGRCSASRTDCAAGAAVRCTGVSDGTAQSLDINTERDVAAPFVGYGYGTAGSAPGPLAASSTSSAGVIACATSTTLPGNSRTSSSVCFARKRRR